MSPHIKASRSSVALLLLAPSGRTQAPPPEGDKTNKPHHPMLHVDTTAPWVMQAPLPPKPALGKALLPEPGARGGEGEGSKPLTNCRIILQ